MIKQYSCLNDSCLLNISVFSHFLNASIVLMSTLFQLLGPWYTNACCPYVLVLVVAMLRMFESNDDRSGLAGIYTIKNS